MAGNVSILLRKDANQIEKFSAEELSWYLSTMAGRNIDIIVNETSGNLICIGSLPNGMTPAEKDRIFNELDTLHKDGFIIRNSGSNLIIQGKTPRATLYGVYSYLQMLGIRWYFPGREYEFIPTQSDIFLRDVDVTESPDMDHRGVVIYFRESAFHDWIDFAAKVKLNAIHLHSDEGIHQMPDLVASKGLDFNVRRHFFGGKYSPADKDELERNKALLLDYVRKLPSQINEFFLWPADVQLELSDDDGKWSISDAILMFTNEMLDAIHSLKPTARMSFLVYWSTWSVPKAVLPSVGMFPEIAHIHQCFSHSIADPACPINSKEVLPVIEDLLRIFDPSEFHVLGYWLDASLFGRGRYRDLSGRLPQMGEIIRQDIKYYKSMGIPNISTFAVELDREYFSRYASPSIFQYPALLWDTDADLKSELAGFCENFYGDRSLSEVFQTSEQIDPRDSNPEKWKAFAERLSHSQLIVKEIMQKVRDDIHILRLERLSRELEHVSNWAVTSCPRS